MMYISNVFQVLKTEVNWKGMLPLMNFTCGWTDEEYDYLFYVFNQKIVYKIDIIDWSDKLIIEYYVIERDDYMPLT